MRIEMLMLMGSRSRVTASLCVLVCWGGVSDLTVGLCIYGSSAQRNT